MSDETTSRPDSARGKGVGDFSVSVEQQDGAWAIVKEVDGERSVVDTHAEEEDARRQAAILEAVATGRETPCETHPR